MRWICVLLFVVGCGEVKAKQPDGGAGDDSGSDEDAGIDGPLVGEATVEVQLGGTPTGGVKVNFHESDGALIADAVTDTSGKTNATVHANAMVTVAVGPNDLVTITGVNPGENIVLKTRPPTDNSTAGDVSFGASAEATNAAFYRVDVGEDLYVTAGSMTSGTRTTSIYRKSLDANGKFHIVAGAYDSTNRLRAYSFVTSVTPSSTGTTNVTFPQPWRTDMLEFNVMMTGAPSGATQLDVITWNEHTGFQFLPSDFGSTNNGTATISGGNASVATVYPGGFGDFIQTEASVRFGTTGESMRLWRRVARPAGAFVIDANDFPARIGSPSLDQSTPTRPVANWTVTGNTVNGDATLVHVSWRDANGATFNWHAYVPPDATSVSFPMVSSSLSAQSPAQTSTSSSIRVTQHCLEPLDGYGAFHLAPPIEYGTIDRMPAGFTTWYYDKN